MDSGATWWLRPSAMPAATTRSRMSAPARSRCPRSSRAAGSDPAGQPHLLLVHDLQRRERGGRDLRQLPDHHRLRQRLQRPRRQRLKTGGEPGLAGWTVDLEDSSGNVLATVLTDSSGNYTFTGVGPGSYQVAQVVQTNWVQTQPLYPTVYTLHDPERPQPDCSELRRPRLTGARPHAGDRQRPGRLLRDRDVEHGGRRLQRHQPGGPDDPRHRQHGHGDVELHRRARQPGYDVYVTYSGKPIYSKAAPFTVYDGGTSLGTQTINESILVTQSQGGLAPGELRRRRLARAGELLHLQRHAQASSSATRRRQLRGRRRRPDRGSRRRQPGPRASRGPSSPDLPTTPRSPCSAWTARPPRARSRRRPRARPEGDHAHRREPAVLAARGVQPGQPGEQQPRTAA